MTTTPAPYFTADHRRLTLLGAVVFLAIGAALSLGALTGVAFWAGAGSVVRRFAHVRAGWLILAAGATVVSHLGYLVSYREVANSGHSPRLDPRRLVSTVVTGFAPFIPRGGFALDADAWREHGVAEAEAKCRVLTLAVLEYAVLAPAALGAAIAFVVRHTPTQAGVVPSWLIGVPAGAGLTLLLIALRARFGEDGRVRSRLARFLVAIERLFAMLRRPGGLLAISGMALYWAGDIGTLAACFLGLTGHAPSLPALIVGYATGYALTRRSLPLAGAGPVELLLPFALSWVSVPLTSAVAAVFAYRLFNVWLPAVPAVVGLRHLRSSGTAMPQAPQQTTGT